jgi:hypothetical protein
MLEDPEHAAVGAMGRQPSAAEVAAPTRAVDLADNPPTRIESGLRNADELVAEHSAEAHVPADQLQIGLAYARAQNAHENLSGLRRGIRVVGAHLNVAIKHKGPHAA